MADVTRNFDIGHILKILDLRRKADHMGTFAKGKAEVQISGRASLSVFS